MTKHANITYEDLAVLIKKRISSKDFKLIKKAYDYAKEKHFGVKRKTGEDYIDHPLNVAYILAEINADATTICAGILHDVLEDCCVTKEEMANEFSLEIANLVDGVTKINKLSFKGANEAMIANHRKILVGLSEDVRVIIIKLADRLHNLRTIWPFSAEKKKSKAKETLDILTPIAHRLGMNTIKAELEDLSLRYYKPDIYFDIVEQLNQTKIERDEKVEEMIKIVSNLLKKNNIKHEIKGRAKSIYSIYKKLSKGKKFSDIFDLLALRIFVNNEQECYQTLGLIHSKFHPLPKRFKDYVANPKTNMYQSLHTTIFGLDGFLFEIQIRTYEMDKVAEQGIAAHWSYKESNGKVAMQSAMENKLQFFKSLMELSVEEKSDEQFVNSVKEEIFKNNIYIFTPNGDVIELPASSTPIDFAYRIHSDIGDKMVGALVNNNIVPLDYELKSNDIVKINVNKNSNGPSREWLNIVKSSQAKNKIRAFFNKIDNKTNVKKGEELLNKELKKRKISLNEFYHPKNIDKLTSNYKVISIEEIYKQIFSSNLTPSQVINFLYNATETKQEQFLKKIQNGEVKKTVVSKNDIIIKGIDQIKINIASCCKPIPEDDLIGYITKGYGITVHRTNCPNIHDDKRIIEAVWNDVIQKKYPTGIIIRTIDLTNILLDIVTISSNNNISVNSVNTISADSAFTYELILEVESVSHLNKFLKHIESNKNVKSVERIIK